jgi:hypothetical protein
MTVSQSGSGPVTTPPFTTAYAGDTLLAFVSSDGPAAAAAQTATVSGAGLTWSLVKRANGQYGDAEIWTATASSALTGATVSSTQGAGGYSQALTVLALSGSAGVGASGSSSLASGAPTVSLTSTAAGSAAFGVGNDWDKAIARTLGSGQALLNQYLNTSSGDTYWSQYLTAPSTAAGQTMTLNDTAPTSDRSRFCQARRRHRRPIRRRPPSRSRPPRPERPSPGTSR